MITEQERNQPKGSMCMACSKSDNDCSKLDFANMPMMYRATLLLTIVKCTEFEPQVKA